MAAPAKQSAGGRRSGSDIALTAGPVAAAAVAAGYLAYANMSVTNEWLHSDAARALGLSTLAGLSTSIGAVVAVVCNRCWLMWHTLNSESVAALAVGCA